MVNKYRGEAAVAIGGVEYRFVYTIGTICEIEAAEKLPIDLVMAKMARGFASTLCLLVWAGLREHHGEITMAEAREITVDMIAEIGPKRAGEVIGAAVAAAFPAPKEGVGDGEKKDQAGSGTVS